jgi:hypothetical protein
MHFASRRMNAASRERDSGFEHHGQCSGQPLKKTRVRMPAPSFSE